MLTREFPVEAASVSGSRVRDLAVVSLRLASRYLDALAHRMAHVPAARPAEEAHVEFHAEAGAPEGAVYVDGKFIGTVVGVTRL